MIVLTRPLIFLDIESTGLFPAQDRIVEIALVRWSPDGTQQEWSSLVNPGMPIPLEASRVHGITDTEVTSAPSFGMIAPRLVDFIGSADLGGFGAARFDVPMLQAEFARSGVAWRLSGRRIVDAMVIFKRMERRNLAAAHRFYCGKDLSGAHRAPADARAALEVFKGQLEKYPDLPRDIGALSDFCRERFA